VLSGCATLPGFAETDATAIRFTGTPGPAGHVLVREDDYPERRYFPLGEVAVAVARPTVFHRNPTRGEVNQKLREAGAKLGADAVILVRYGTLDGELLRGGTFEGKGLAIKFAP